MAYVYHVKESVHKPIALWSGPRNLSTALMYSFGNRQDCRVIDEPLFGYFLQKTGVWRPSREEVLKVMETDPACILKDMRDAKGRSMVFSKNMANHLEGLDLKLLLSFQNVILTREPTAVLGSYTRQVKHPTPLDLCYHQQLRIIEYLQHQDLPILVLDSDQLRSAPEVQLQKLCAYLDIDFRKKMLRWKAGARAEDGVWAKYWYQSVHQSTGFSPAPVNSQLLPAEYQELYRNVSAVYHQIITFKNE